LKNRINIFNHGLVFFYSFQSDFGVAVDNGEDIVEVVGNAAGQAADSFDFLNLVKLFRQSSFFFFGMFAFGNIADCPDNFRWVSIGIDMKPGSNTAKKNSSIFIRQAKFIIGNPGLFF